MAFNGLDPSLLLGIKPIDVPDPMKTAAAGLSLRAMMDADSQRKLKQQEQDELQQAVPEWIQQGGTLQAAQAVAQKYKVAGPSILKMADERMKSEADTRKSDAETADKTASAKSKAFQAIGGAAREESQNPRPDSMSRIQFLAKQYDNMPLPPFQGDQNDPQAVKQYMTRLYSQSISAKDQIAQAETAANNQRIDVRAVATLDQTKIRDTQTAKNQDAMRYQAEQREKRLSDPSNVTVGHGTANLSPEQNAALIRAVSERKLDGGKINSRTAGLLANMFLENPDMDMAGESANIALSRNAAYRQRAMTAEQLPEIMSNVVEAGKKVNFSRFAALGGIQAFVKGQINDPDYVSYMAQRNDALMTIAHTMRGVGMTDMAHKAEQEAMHPTMSPPALEAWFKAQIIALGPRIRMNEKVIGKSGVVGGVPVAAPVTAPVSTDGWSITEKKN